jgi:DNA (cytosine-5)-methyltransferase 1
VRELALFAGAGGGILGGRLLGWRTVCAVEFASYPRSVLLARQRDGQLSRFPIWDDVTTFDGKPWRGRVDVVSGGFPCQDISSAGKGAGLDGARSGLWSEMARIVREVRPRFVFVENSPMLTSRGLGVVLGDLAEMGFDAEWCVLGARDVGAPHKRARIWILARSIPHPMHEGPQGHRAEHGLSETSPKGEACRRCDDAAMANSKDNRSQDGRLSLGAKALGSKFGLQGGAVGEGDLANPNGERFKARDEPGGSISQAQIPAGGDVCKGGKNWEAEPDVGRVAHGVAARVDRLKAIGNGQVPQCAALAWRVLSERLGAR